MLWKAIAATVSAAIALIAIWVNAFQYTFDVHAFLSDEIYYIPVSLKYMKFLHIPIPKPCDAAIVSLNGSMVSVERISDAYCIISAVEHNYYNLEHPPFGKYLFGIAAVLTGNPFKGPRLVTLILAIIAIVAIAYTFTRTKYSCIAVCALTAAYAFTDRTFQYMSSIAMLDIVAASLAVLSALLAYREKYVYSSILAGLAAGTKYTVVLTPLIPVLWSYVRKRDAAYSLSLLAISITTFTILWIPIIYSLGVKETFEGVLKGVKWLLTTKTHPAGTDPLGLLVGRNPFSLAVGYVALKVVPSVFFTITPLAVIPVAIFNRRLRRLTPIMLLYTLNVIAITIAYLGGNHSLYTYYSIAYSLPGYAVYTSVSSSLIDYGNEDM